MTSVLDGVLERGPFAAEGGRTGASFEYAVLSDGTPVVIKHLSTDDWLFIAGGGVSYVDTLWRAGTYDRLPSVIDHVTLAVEPADDGFVLVMRDVSPDVFEEGRVLSRHENRRVLEAMNLMYQEFWGESLPGCPIDKHIRAFCPEELEAFEHLDTPIPGLMRRGWEMFSDVAPADVTDVMHVLQKDPSPLITELEKRPFTLIHGDLRLHNMGLTDECVILFDWEIAGNAPPALEFCWYLIISASRIDATREEIIDDFRAVSGDRFDAHGLELGMIAALMFLGWNKAIDIIENPDHAIRAQERADLDWWIARVRRALETWSPP